MEGDKSGLGGPVLGHGHAPVCAQHPAHPEALAASVFEDGSGPLQLGCGPRRARAAGIPSSAMARDPEWRGRGAISAATRGARGDSGRTGAGRLELRRRHVRSGRPDEGPRQLREGGRHVRRGRTRGPVCAGGRRNRQARIDAAPSNRGVRNRSTVRVPGATTGHRPDLLRARRCNPELCIRGRIPQCPRGSDGLRRALRRDRCRRQRIHHRRHRSRGSARERGGPLGGLGQAAARELRASRDSWRGSKAPRHGQVRAGHDDRGLSHAVPRMCPVPRRARRRKERSAEAARRPARAGS